MAESYRKVICNDKQRYLISMLKAVKAGYELPDAVTEEEYKRIKANIDDDPILSGFVGFGCAFGGQWFGTYARSGDRNVCKQAKNSLLKKLAKLQNAEFLCEDYRDVELPEGAVVYCDPPYAGTAGYLGEKFDSEAFWDYVREISKNHLVFVSEMNAPDDFTCIWEKPFKRTMCSDASKRKVVVEKLFML